MINIEIKLKSGAPVYLNIEEAKDLYEQLGTLFDKGPRVSEVLNKYVQQHDPRAYGPEIFGPPRVGSPFPNYSPAIGPICHTEDKVEVEPR